jgi:hypothetical protein
MMPSRGMGDISPSKMPGKKIIHRKDNPNDVEVYKRGGEVWDKPNPAKKHKKLSPAKKAAAKAAAKKAGRPYPNLIDNMRMSK